MYTEYNDQLERYNNDNDDDNDDNDDNNLIYDLTRPRPENKKGQQIIKRS